MTAHYDYIIIGGGTAGCVLANRLSAQPQHTVLLIEAGGKPQGLWPKMPAGTAKMFNRGPYNWGFESEEVPQLSLRRIYAPRGKGLGGSSLINGMVIGRGHAQDFDSWAQWGVRGWSWKEVLPHFKAMEQRQAPAGQPRSDLRGYEGELCVSDPRYMHPASRDFARAAEQAGYTRNDDLNGAQANEGVGVLQLNIQDGERHSAAHAFLLPVQQRPNLTVITHAHVERIVLEGGHARGVEFVQGGQRQQVRAAREVVLAAGAFGSPHILMHSGIGPQDVLQRAGVPVQHVLGGVGRNLQDHFYIHAVYGCTAHSSLNGDFSGWRKVLHGIQYLATKQGALTMGASQTVAFVKALAQSERADTQINFKPVTWQRQPDGSVSIMRRPEFSAATCFLRPHSRGRVELRSANPLDAPLIYPNYLDSEVDWQAALSALRIARTIFAQPAMAQRTTGEHLPGAQVQSDEDLRSYVRQYGASMHHWAGSCRMGTDAGAVVDERLRVHGVGGLRVVDASVFPLIPSTNTNAPTFMLADRAAQFIVQDAQRAATEVQRPVPERQSTVA